MTSDLIWMRGVVSHGLLDVIRFPQSVYTLLFCVGVAEVKRSVLGEVTCSTSNSGSRFFGYTPHPFF